MSAAAGVAATVLLAGTALAQGYGSSTTTYEVNSNGQEEVTITSPTYSPWQSSIGAPYRRITMSVPVAYSDLNLHTGEGVYTLRQRVKYTARDICNKLSFRNPVGIPDSDLCYSHAVTNAMPQADAAVWNYRSTM
jgi:UrcA family protein